MVVEIGHYRPAMGNISTESDQPSNPTRIEGFGKSNAKITSGGGQMRSMLNEKLFGKWSFDHENWGYSIGTFVGDKVKKDNNTGFSWIAK